MEVPLLLPLPPGKARGVVVAGASGGSTVARASGGGESGASSTESLRGPGLAVVWLEADGECWWWLIWAGGLELDPLEEEAGKDDRLGAAARMLEERLDFFLSPPRREEVRREPGERWMR